MKLGLFNHLEGANSAYCREKLCIKGEVFALICFSRLNTLRSSYIMFTSNHGFHMGQFRRPPGVHQPYDTDIRIPLLVR